jgi:hypothetical protein
VDVFLIESDLHTRRQSKDYVFQSTPSVYYCTRAMELRKLSEISSKRLRGETAWTSEERISFDGLRRYL